MNRTNVFTRDGTGMPRRCAIQMPSGSIDAATTDATSILRGVAGRIIDPTRMTIVFHETCPIAAVVTVRACELTSATKIAFSTMNSRPTSAFVCGAPAMWRIHTNIPAETTTPRTSMTTVSVRGAGPTVSGKTMVSMTKPNSQRPAPTAPATARRWTCSERSSSGSRVVAVSTIAPGRGVCSRGWMIFFLGFDMVAPCKGKRTASAHGVM